MHYTRVFSVLALLTSIALQMSPVAAICCYCNGDGRCNDGTECTPYCAYRPCNIFGCNCPTQCRSNYSTQAFLTVPGGGHEDASEYYFDQADTNKDGKLTFEEWAALDRNKGIDHKVLEEQWAGYDFDKVGYLTKVQAIVRTG